MRNGLPCSFCGASPLLLTARAKDRREGGRLEQLYPVPPITKAMSLGMLFTSYSAHLIIRLSSFKIAFRSFNRRRWGGDVSFVLWMQKCLSLKLWQVLKTFLVEVSSRLKIYYDLKCEWSQETSLEICFKVAVTQEAQNPSLERFAYSEVTSSGFSV